MIFIAVCFTGIPAFIILYKTQRFVIFEIDNTRCYSSEKKICIGAPAFKASPYALSMIQQHTVMGHQFQYARVKDLNTFCGKLIRRSLAVNKIQISSNSLAQVSQSFQYRRINSDGSVSTLSNNHILFSHADQVEKKSNPFIIRTNFELNQFTWLEFKSLPHCKMQIKLCY